MLIGWFLISAAIAEEQAAMAKTALAGVRVADVMTPHPRLAPGWATVAEFLPQAAQSLQEALPVTSISGALTGIVLTSQLARIRPDNRVRLRLDQAALAVPPAYRAAPGDPAAPLLTRRPLGGQVASIVLDGAQVTGIVTLSDLQRAPRWRKLTGAGRRQAQPIPHIQDRSSPSYTHRGAAHGPCRAGTSPLCRSGAGAGCCGWEGMTGEAGHGSGQRAAGQGTARAVA